MVTEPVLGQTESVVTRWTCDVCKHTGDVPMRPDTGVWEGFMRITDAHRADAPHCSAAAPQSIRVEIVKGPLDAD